MGHRLKDNITSHYVEAANKLVSKRARHKVIAYVESYEDVFFWRTILSRFETPNRYFEVMLPSRMAHLERGKKAAISNLLDGVGQDMIACVDADYDYLMQGASPGSRILLDNPYVFHTFAYAIENLQCYAPSLHNVAVPSYSTTIPSSISMISCANIPKLSIHFSYGIFGIIGQHTTENSP